MDAEPSTSVAVERVTEPFSGMRLVRVTGYWQGATAPPTHFDVRLDGETVTRCEPVPVTVGGQARVNFGTQFPEESAVTLAVVAVFAAGEHVLASRPVASLDTVADTPHQPGFLGRVLKSVASGEVVSPARWAARLGRAAAKASELREKVQGRLLARRFRPRDPHLGYVENTAVTPRLQAAMTAEIDRFRHGPTFSILVPVYLDAKKRIGSRWLRRAVESVRAQAYPHWELCLADDGSTDPDLLRYLDRLPADPRIKLVRRAENGHICRATNSAADLATGEFVCLLDHDDELAPHALFAVAERLQTRPDADLIYSDEDKTDAAGRRYDPQFKPAWSPELLLSYNYVNHFTTIRRSVFEAAGRFRPGFEGSQDHDLLLRVTERTDRVEHIPQVLYHWRSLPDSTATAAGVKTYVHTSGRRAVEEALTRRGIAAELYVPPFATKLGLPVLALDGPDDGPSVAVVVSGEAEAARRTVRALRQTTAYRGFTDYLVIDRDPPAERLNRMAAGRTEDLLLFLEAGCEPTDPRWLSRLVANLRIPGVGAVGGRIVDATGAGIDAGIVTGMRDGIAPAPAFAGLEPTAISYYFLAEVTRTVSVVSGRCLLTRRDTFEQLGGFDARRYPHSLWDVDFSLRVRGRGLRCAVVPGAELKRTGAAPPEFLPSELLSLRRAHGRLLDPYHNPNCSERTPWKPVCDAPLSLPSEATRPAVRALVVAHNLNNPEGAPRYLSEIVLGLRDRGALAPVIVSPFGGPGAAVYADAGIPVDVRETPQSRRFVDGLWTPAEYRAARRTADAVLRQHRPEVVIANTLTTFPLVEAAARAGIPAVWIIHESYSRETLVRLFPPFARMRVELAFALAARVIPASHDTAALFTHLNTRGNVRVIHNGLDPAAFPPVRKLPAGPVRFLAVGTVCERKGQHTLIEAAARLARERTDFACDLVGLRSGIPYADYCRELVRRHCLDGMVNLVPETDRVTDYLRAADVFVCTSHMETFSRAVLEAEAFGLPILSTPVHGVPEQVFWGANALRFEFGDAAGLAERMREVLANPGLRAKMAAESRAAFDLHLTQNEMLDRYAAVILSAARQGPRARTPLAAPPTAARRAA
ncbi:glycosyltransferase [Urbifossiella limnaea]|uniref:Chondroitin synthase n=1 Tax=Urbifossiella limnaea TaxID=2528023 RepID=A0A517XT96_9BACT|nr:glycosyltransferase [Urbifossiella limnaea]QDU20718.1 Chondroitin synthase [Urbifossiella limnaea]